MLASQTTSLGHNVPHYENILVFVGCVVHICVGILHPLSAVHSKVHLFKDLQALDNPTPN